MSFDPELYRHDLEKRAFDALNLFPQLVRLQEAYLANFDEKAVKIELLSTAVRLSENQFPEIYDQLPPICEKLGITIPELYYVKSKEMNAAAGGSRNPYIYITSEMVKKMPAELISSVLAHECGHIACSHYLYHSIARTLLNGIERSPLFRIPAVRRYLEPTLARTLLFWYRCSELSADRAAVLCDGSADKTIDMLLRVHGYKNINREEFLKQAMDLREFINDSKSNKLIEQIMVKDTTHPMLAARVSECYEWGKTEQFHGILDGTYTIGKMRDAENNVEEEEIIAAEVAVVPETSGEKMDMDRLNAALDRVASELEKCTARADKWDYAFAVFSGIVSGMIDSLFVGESVITNGDIALSHRQVNRFIQRYAMERGFDHEHLKDAVSELEEAFRVPQDNVWKGEKMGVTPKNHHLADIAHHPTPLGLVSSILVQLFRISVFVNKDGEWHLIFLTKSKDDTVNLLVPAVMTGILNWLVFIAEKKYEQNGDRKIPEAIRRLAHLAASAPILIELAKCADNWFGHLVSDMGGSRNTAGAGMGIPGMFISLLYEFASLPVMRNTGLLSFVNGLYEKQRIDLRHELPLYKMAGKQAVPVIFNEICVRVVYFISHFISAAVDHDKSIKEINWNMIIPFHNRTVDRMLTVSGMTFTIADTADAAVHAAIESGGDWVLFSGRFVTRFNYMGAGRAAAAVVREISNEKKETQLIHEKMILSEEKAAIFLNQLQEFKKQLEEKISGYLTEDLEAFAEGFDFINQGLASGDSDQVIKGNVVIQRVLGREPQFTNQQEFDDLMESETPLVL